MASLSITPPESGHCWDPTTFMELEPRPLYRAGTASGASVGSLAGRSLSPQDRKQDWTENVGKH